MKKMLILSNFILLIGISFSFISGINNNMSQNNIEDKDQKILNLIMMNVILILDIQVWNLMNKMKQKII